MKASLSSLESNRAHYQNDQQWGIALNKIFGQRISRKVHLFMRHDLHESLRLVAERVMNQLSFQCVSSYCRASVRCMHHITMFWLRFDQCTPDASCVSQKSHLRCSSTSSHWLVHVYFLQSISPVDIRTISVLVLYTSVTSPVPISVTSTLRQRHRIVTPSIWSRWQLHCSNPEAIQASTEFSILQLWKCKINETDCQLLSAEWKDSLLARQWAKQTVKFLCRGVSSFDKTISQARTLLE